MYGPRTTKYVHIVRSVPLVSFRTTSKTVSTRVEGPLVLEVLGEVDEDEDFVDTGVNHKDGSLDAGEVEGNDGIVLLGARVLGNQGVDVFRQAGDDGMLEDLDSGDLGQLKRRLSLAFESDNIDGGTTELEEVIASRYVAHVEDVSVDASQRLLSLSGGGNEVGAASNAQQLLCAGDTLGKSARLNWLTRRALENLLRVVFSI